jgi:hypothetical protein
MFLQRVTLVAATLLLVGPTESTPTPHADAQLAPTDSMPVAPTEAPPGADPAADRAVVTAPTPGPARVTFPEPLSAVEWNAVQWAVERFESAGLELPTVSISFSADSDDCAGEQGVYRLRSGEHFVVVCGPEREGAAIDHRRRRTLLHELAHAWDHATLTDAERRNLQYHFGAGDWYAPDRPWEERPVEQIAETLTWGLLDQRRRPLLIDRPCWDVHADFRAVTAHRPLGPIEPLCELEEPDPGSGSTTPVRGTR